MNQFEQHEDFFSILDIKSFFYMLWSWTWLILLAGLLTGAVAYVISIRTTPIYQTSARLLVSDPPAQRSLDTNSMVSTQSMASTYKEMLVDWVVLQGVIDRLNLNVSPSAIQNEISVNTIAGTQLLVVTVKDPNPNRATDIANTLGQVFAEHIRELQTQRYSASQAGLAKQVSDMEQQINITTQALSAVTDQAEKLQLEARLTQYRGLYSNLVTNYEQVRLAEAQTSTNVVVSQPAISPTEPVSPKTTTNVILGVLAGLLLATVIIIIVDILDDTLKNPDDIRQKFNLPILGFISIHAMEDDKPISLSQPRSPVAESFRSLRTNITYSSVDKPLRRILITSTMPQEGKTTISSNLAVVFAQGEKKSILIDADLRRPRLHTFFDISNSVGLTNYLTTELMLEDVILQTPVDNLYFMPSGILPADAAGILNSRRMSELIQDVKQRFDLVLVDSPPILGVSDAAVLASEVDLTMIVVQHRKLPRNMLLRVKQAFENVGGTVIGVVLNNVDVRSDSQYQYYTSYYTYYAPAEAQLGPPTMGAAPKPQAASKSQPAARGNDTELY